MTHLEQPAVVQSAQHDTYLGPEWMGRANWHSVAETYLLKMFGKPGVYAGTQLMLAVNRRFPRVLLGLSYDVTEPLMTWMPGVGGTRTERVRLPHCPAEWTWNVKHPFRSADPVVIYFHGSGFIALGINSHRPLVSRIARDAGVRVLSVGYRLLPRHDLEDAIADGVDAYRYVLSTGVDPKDIVLAGDSAGGAVAVMTAIRARDEGLVPPAGCALLSPPTNPDMAAKLRAAERSPDAMFPRATLRMLHDVFVLRNGQRRDPVPSPVASDLTGLGPFLIQVGSEEALRPDAELLGERLAASGVPVRVQIYDRAIHIFQFTAVTNPDARRAVAEIVDFVRSVVASGGDRRDSAIR